MERIILTFKDADGITWYAAGELSPVVVRAGTGSDPDKELMSTLRDKGEVLVTEVKVVVD